jgi:hypothetical protein
VSQFDVSGALLKHFPVRTGFGLVVDNKSDVHEKRLLVKAYKRPKYEEEQTQKKRFLRAHRLCKSGKLLRAIIW